MDKIKKIIVENNELSFKRAKKEAEKAEKSGYKVAFDLRGIEDKEVVRNFMMNTKD